MQFQRYSKLAPSEPRKSGGLPHKHNASAQLQLKRSSKRWDERAAIKSGDR
jgi:cob(I)alamin adenosyltransferase